MAPKFLTGSHPACKSKITAAETEIDPLHAGVFTIFNLWRFFGFGYIGFEIPGFGARYYRRPSASGRR